MRVDLSILKPIIKNTNKLSKLKVKGVNLSTIIIILVFLFGIIFITNNHKLENMEQRNESTRQENMNKPILGDICPNILVRKGKELHLLNTKKAKIPGVNPIKFDNLEEYVEFLDYQKKMGVKCPVLYYQETYDTQNNKGFRVLDDPLEPNSGLSSNLEVPQIPPLQNAEPKKLLTDANIDNNHAFNQHQFSGFDEKDQYIGSRTDLDAITGDESDGKSTNPMAKNWGGHKFTHDAIQEGKFEGRIRKAGTQNFVPKFTDEY